MFNTFDHSDFSISETRMRREKWKDWLRSGNYIQEENYLHTGGKRFCSIGVGCELYRLSAMQGHWEKDDDETKYYHFVGAYGNTPQSLLQEVYDYYGLEELINKLPFDLDLWREEAGHKTFAASFFIYLNDRRGMTFKEVADVLDMMENPKMFEDQLKDLYEDFMR